MVKKTKQRTQKKAPWVIKVIHGATDGKFCFAEARVPTTRFSLVDALNIVLMQSLC